MKENTLVILKPDAIRRGFVGKIINRFEDKGLKIEYMNMTTLKEKDILEHYAHLTHLPHFNAIVKFMITGNAIVLVLSGENAVSIVRSMIGSTFNSEVGTIRGDYTLNSTCGDNLIHASDCLENAMKEIYRFVGNFTFLYQGKDSMVDMIKEDGK